MGSIEGGRRGTDNANVGRAGEENTAHPRNAGDPGADGTSPGESAGRAKDAGVDSESPKVGDGDAKGNGVGQLLQVGMQYAKANVTFSGGDLEKGPYRLKLQAAA